jgi:hypothetical protein
MPNAAFFVVNVSIAFVLLTNVVFGWQLPVSAVRFASEQAPIRSLVMMVDEVEIPARCHVSRPFAWQVFEHVLLFWDTPDLVSSSFFDKTEGVCSCVFQNRRSVRLSGGWM